MSDETTEEVVAAAPADEAETPVIAPEATPEVAPEEEAAPTEHAA